MGLSAEERQHGQASPCSGRGAGRVLGRKLYPLVIQTLQERDPVAWPEIIAGRGRLLAPRHRRLRKEPTPSMAGLQTPWWRIDQATEWSGRGGGRRSGTGTQKGSSQDWGIFELVG